MSGRIAPGANGSWISYNYAILRVVPHVHLGTFVPGRRDGARPHRGLPRDARPRGRSAASRTRSGVDLDLLVRYLRACQLVCEGETAGPVALAPPSERFHWLTAPRSDVIQSSPVHSGMTEDPKAALDELYARFIERLPNARSMHEAAECVDREPASPPTTVPLMRMNCRSRPTSSSSFSVVSLGSQRSTVSAMTAAISSR